jgi:hypothetical protein
MPNTTTSTKPSTTNLRTRIRTQRRIANDNGRPTRVVSLEARRAGAARRRALMRDWGPAILATFFTIGCGPTFDPASLVASTRVVGAHVEAAGADDRASAAPGESATVTWLVTAPAAVPNLQWAFALCTPGAGGALGCTSPPLALFQGTGNPPAVPVVMPAADALGGATHLTLFGRICDTGAPTFDPETGNPGCADGPGTTASVSIRVQTPDTVNHNPTADHGLLFDGQPWPALAAGADPCAAGPTVVAGSEDHAVTVTTEGTDREAYTVLFGDPPAPTAKREALQVSFFTTSGKLKSPFAFVEAADPSPETPAAVSWNAPKPANVPAPTPVTFTFVVRDGRGGTDWTTRAACVTP